MQIKKGLAQFKDDGALLVVTGDCRAKFYSAINGQIDLVDEFESKMIGFDERKSLVGDASGGEGPGGAPQEKTNLAARNKFVKELAKKISTLKKVNKAKLIYLFSPAYMHLLIEKSFTADIRAILKLTIIGNHLHAKPLDLIEKIEKSSKGGCSGKTIIKETVRKILKKK